MAIVPGIHSVVFMVSDDKPTDDPEGHTELLAAVVQQALHERFPRLMVARLEYDGEDDQWVNAGAWLDPTDRPR